MSKSHPAVTLTALTGIPSVAPGDDIATILADALDAGALVPQDRDVLVVPHQIIPKAGGRYRDPAGGPPSAPAPVRAGAPG